MSSTFAAATRGASASAKKKKRRSFGTRVSDAVNIAARVRFTVERILPGRRHGKGKKVSCVRPSKKNRKGRRCARLVTLRTTLTVSAKAGNDSFHFSARLGGKKLKRGNYILLATPTANGKTGRSVGTPFRIIK